MTQTKQSHRMNIRFRSFILAALAAVLSIPGFAQQHHGNWLHRNMMDTTVVHCWNDSLSTIHVPPGSMGMMMPDSMYCRMETMPMDSLHHPYDSTHIGWCRVMMGDDSLHFNLMHCDSGSGHGGHHGMEFMRGLRCEMRWDSLRCDSTRRHWRPTGVRGWNGTGWVTIPGVTFDENTAVFTTTQLYSAYSFIGVPNSPTAVETRETTPAQFGLQQNYPNPFNPSTSIRFSLSNAGYVTLKVYNILGAEVATLIDNQIRSAGEHSITFDARGISSGVYLYKLQVGQQTALNKMLLLR